MLRGVELANSLGIKTIALTGMGGKLAELSRVAIAVPSQNTQLVQEAHLAIEHLLCELVEKSLFGEQ